jgi:hypothetical protein
MRSKANTTTRRGFIAGATLVAAAVSSGAFWIGSRAHSREAWVEAVLRRHLPGIELDPTSLATFVRSFVQRHEFEGAPLNQLAVWAYQAAPSIARRIPQAERRIERLERLAMSEYLLGSNFFRGGGQRPDTVIYGAAPSACGNPFAVFRDS